MRASTRSCQPSPTTPDTRHCIGWRAGRIRRVTRGSPSPTRNNAKLLAELIGKGDRSAYYYCVMVLLRHADDPQPVIAEGVWHGTVTDTPRGDNGFGYDPYFLLPELGKTAAELDPASKNRLSHRGRALAALVEKLGDRATWL